MWCWWWNIRAIARFRSVHWCVLDGGDLVIDDWFFSCGCRRCPAFWRRPTNDDYLQKKQDDNWRTNASSLPKKKRSKNIFGFSLVPSFSGASLYITWCMKTFFLHFLKAFFAFLLRCFRLWTDETFFSRFCPCVGALRAPLWCVKIVKCRLRAGWRTRKNADSILLFDNQKCHYLISAFGKERSQQRIPSRLTTVEHTTFLSLSPRVFFFNRSCSLWWHGWARNEQSKKKKKRKIHEAENSPSAYTNIVARSSSSLS